MCEGPEQALPQVDLRNSQRALIIEEPEVDDTIPATTFHAPPQQHKHVTFDRLHIQEYPVILGDHPSTSSGLPVTLDWNVTSSYQVNVSQYEQAAVRRAKLELRMPPEVRRELLQPMNVADNDETLHACEMKRVTKELRRIKSQRAHTIAMQEFESFFVFFESVGRKWRRWRNRWSDAGVDDPAAIWLQEWQRKKNMEKQESNRQQCRRSSQLDRAILMKVECDMSRSMTCDKDTLDIGASESTRRTESSDSANDCSTELLASNMDKLAATCTGLGGEATVSPQTNF